MDATIIIALATLALLLAAAQALKVRMLSRSNFDNLSPAALRWQLRLWSIARRPCAIVALDIRKLHDLNAVLGYSTSNELIRDLISARQHQRSGHARRWLDLVGQWGGDELVVALADPSGRERVLQHMQARLTELSARLTVEQRQALYDRTGGLVDGLHAAISVVSYTHDAYGATVRAVDATGPLKEGRMTGARSTSGAVGTVMQVLS
jgi:GGDEF domain-containing protein